jgi:hypothetical protein
MRARSRRPRVGAILGSAMSGALDWRLLTLFTIVVLVPTAVSAVPVWRVLASALDHSPRAEQIAEAFDLLAFQDLGMAVARSGASISGATIVATVVAVLSWPFLAAMVIGAAGVERPRSFSELLVGGVVYYTRMLRFGLVALLPFALVGGAIALIARSAFRYAERAILESHATLGWRAAFAISALLFVVVHASLEAGRAAFGADDGLRSAWQAWWRGVALTIRHPLRVLGTYFGASLASYALAIPLLIGRLHVSGPSNTELAMGFVLAQLAVAALGWGKAARLFALTALARSHSPISATPADAPATVPNATHAASRPAISRPGSA